MCIIFAEKKVLREISILREYNDFWSPKGWGRGCSKDELTTQGVEGLKSQKFRAKLEKNLGIELLDSLLNSIGAHCKKFTPLPPQQKKTWRILFFFNLLSSSSLRKFCSTLLSIEYFVQYVVQYLVQYFVQYVGDKIHTRCRDSF